MIYFNDYNYKINEFYLKDKKSYQIKLAFSDYN